MTNERDARLEALPTIGQAGLAALRRARVAVVGVGNIGGQLAHHLVLLGANVMLIDRDVVAEVNLGTQGFAERHVGRSKSEARAEWLAALNPACHIQPVHADLRRLGFGALRDTSLIFSCLDSRAVRVTLNEIAMRLGIPWIDGALDGSGAALFGRVACYDFRDAECACYLCPHDGSSLRDIAAELSLAKGCSAQWWRAADQASAPTLASSALGGAVASLQAVWGLRVLLGHSADIAGKEIYFDLSRPRLSMHRLRKNPRCPLDHHRWQLTPLRRDANSTTVAETFSFAELRLHGEVVMQPVGRSVVTRMRCPRCHHERHPYCVVNALNALDVRCRCGEDMVLTSADAVDRFGRYEAKPFLDRTWGEIGLASADVLVATGADKELHMVFDASRDC